MQQIVNSTDLQRENWQQSMAALYILFNYVYYNYVTLGMHYDGIPVNVRV